MTTGEFAATDWVERLAQALAELAATQERYRDELDQIEREMSQGSEFDHSSDTLWDFYAQACFGKDRFYAGEHSPLCAALAEVRRVLAVHPAWAGLVDPFDSRDEFWTQILSHGSSGSLLSIIAGLMARGMEVPENGFRVAASELHGLLDPGGDQEQSPVPGDLSVGYHVALFHGLQVREKVSLAGGTAILPFEQLDAFVNERILQDFAPAIMRDNLRKSMNYSRPSLCERAGVSCAKASAPGHRASS